MVIPLLPVLLGIAAAWGVERDGGPKPWAARSLAACCGVAAPAGKGCPDDGSSGSSAACRRVTAGVAISAEPNGPALLLLGRPLNAVEAGGRPCTEAADAAAALGTGGTEGPAPLVAALPT